MLQNKTITDIAIGHTLPVGTAITVEVSLDGGNWQTAGTANVGTNVTHLTNAGLLCTKDCNELQVRAVLSTTNTTLTPLLKEMLITYQERL